MSASRAAPRSRAAAARPAPLAMTRWLGALVAVAYFHVLRLGYFADDFVFLDAARRQPLAEVLLGWHGVWPWYRPLSREIFFALAGLAGRAGPVLAHLVALATLWVAADALWRVLARRLDAMAATIAVALFLSHTVTFFLTGWLSGFQDLLALALGMVALRLQHAGRVRATAITAALAAMAKESGFLVLPLLAVDVMFGARRAPARREWLAWLAAGVAAASLHVLARATWPKLAQPVPIVEGVTRGLPVVLRALVPWTVPPGRADADAWIAGGLAAALVFAMLRAVARKGRFTGELGPMATWATAALILGALPGLAPLLSQRLPQQVHYVFPALPWAGALLGIVLARVETATRWTLPLLCGACVWSAVARRVDLDAPDGWAIAQLRWADAQRTEARTRRLEGEVRALLADRPESLLVGYIHVPSGTWFQTGDGPATRIALGDPTVIARMAQELPLEAVANPRAAVALLDFDPIQRHGLVRLSLDDPRLLPHAVQQELSGATARARVMALFASRHGPSAALARYIAAVAAFAGDRDRAAFEGRVFAVRAGSSEQLDIGASAGVAELGPALARPLEPEAHRYAADRLAESRQPVLEALELSVAVQLDSTRAEDALRLARLLSRTMPDAARRAYAVAGAPGAPPELAAAARREAASLTGSR